jgi:hypothetical protein
MCEKLKAKGNKRSIRLQEFEIDLYGMTEHRYPFQLLQDYKNLVFDKGVAEINKRWLAGTTIDFWLTAEMDEANDRCEPADR